MAKKPTVPKRVYVEQGTYIPEGLIYVEALQSPYATDSDPDEDSTDATDVAFLPIDFDSSELQDVVLNSGTDSSSLPTPDTFTIVSQTVRIASNGQSVVDVIIDLPDVPGGGTYEIRYAK